MKLIGTLKADRDNAEFRLWENGQLDFVVDDTGWATGYACTLEPDETAKLLALLALTAAAKDTP